MLKQHSPQLPPHQQNPCNIESNILPFGDQKPLRNVRIREHSTFGLNHAGGQQIPQQYAQVVPKVSEHTFSAGFSHGSFRDGRQAEHMLRRKTPNGVLHAAYDGTSVEHDDRTHAMKHIILPVSEHHSASRFARNLGHESPSIQSSPRFDQGPHFLHNGYEHQVPQLQGDGWRQSAMTIAQDQQWNLGRAQHQYESVLNQYPMQVPQSFPYYQNGYLGYGFVPQPLQPSFVPTASNRPGPYGPYWPNGQYQPYCPAVTRDLRFHPNYSTGWMQQQPIHHGPFNHAPNQLISHSLQLSQQYPNYSPRHADIQTMPLGQLRAPYPVNNSFLGALPRQELPSNVPSTSAPGEIPRFMPNLSRITATTQSSKSIDASTDATPGSVEDEYGAGSRNCNLRDRIFKQAVSIYVELVRHLHKSRATAVAHSRGNTSNQAHRMYPKPPRPSSQDYSIPPAPLRHNSAGMVPQHRPSINTQRHSFRDTLDPVQGWNLNASNSGQQEHVNNSPWQQPQQIMHNAITRSPPSDRLGHLRHGSAGQLSGTSLIPRQDHFPVQNALSALEILAQNCEESKWQWVDGLLLGGSLAYALADYQKAYDWYSKILAIDARHVEAMSNLAATLLAMSNRKEAEEYWTRAVKLRPSYFEAVEHLIGLLCSENRNKEAIKVLDDVEQALRTRKRDTLDIMRSERSPCPSEASDKPVFDYEGEHDLLSDRKEMPGADQPGFGSSGYNIPGTDNARIHTLVHARGNLLYAAGDIVGAAQAFEEAVLIIAGRQFGTMDGLVKHIIESLHRQVGPPHGQPANEPLLLPPLFALETLKICFPPDGSLPGLRDLPAGAQGIKAALATTSNSLLSLAKIFQDGMASSSTRKMPFKTSFGVQEILALYYLSLALQQSPSTANNVGILLAGLQQSVTPKMLEILQRESLPTIPGVVPGTGIHLALAYYNYGLNLDRRHAHLYTNLGSLLKDLGQLQTAIRMYEEAVKCDPKFDIALANLANAVKDQGRIADAITYYQRAVDSSPDFAEAVCGLANALNSVCGWQGRGGIADMRGGRDRWHVNHEGKLMDARDGNATSSGWIKRVVDLVDRQLAGGENWGLGAITMSFVEQIIKSLKTTTKNSKDFQDQADAMKRVLGRWSGQNWEGQRVVRFIERSMKRLTWQWYHDKYITPQTRPPGSYDRPMLPLSVSIPSAPTVLPFHTFTSPMSAKQIRQISQRNGLRISASTLKAHWMPTTTHCPPAPPQPYLKVGYVSSDFNNHPLAHLMQSVFGLHDTNKVKAYCYATTASDKSTHREQIERESPVFHDASAWSAEKLVAKILEDGIHILVNLNGYTRGARNEVFAARAAPIQMSFMGFAGTLGAEWCDYLLADETAVPTDTLRPWRRNVDLEDQVRDEAMSLENDDWIYAENIIYCRDTFFCCDHRQSAPDSQTASKITWEEEQQTRWAMRKELFPDLSDDAIILGNFNQLYKIEPTTFRTWLRILDQVPSAVLWLLRFPDLGEQYLKKTALLWAGSHVASRVLFTDVAPKQQHISRARICDLFLDTPECNAHTTAADILWSGTPLLTLPRYKYKMCSRMAASILKGALPRGHEGKLAASQLIAKDEDDYELKAVALASGLTYDTHHQQIGRLGELRKLLWQGRWTSALFDTRRWVRDLEEAYDIAWTRWVHGEGGDIWLESKKE